MAEHLTKKAQDKLIKCRLKIQFIDHKNHHLLHKWWCLGHCQLPSIRLLADNWWWARPINPVLWPRSAPCCSSSFSSGLRKRGFLWLRPTPGRLRDFACRIFTNRLDQIERTSSRPAGAHFWIFLGRILLSVALQSRILDVLHLGLTRFSLATITTTVIYEPNAIQNQT